MHVRPIIIVLDRKEISLLERHNTRFGLWPRDELEGTHAS